MEEKLILKHRGDFDYFLLSRTENYEAVIASLNPDELEQKLSKENCDKIFGVIDIDKLVDEYIVVKPKYREHEHNLSASAYKQGFNKAIELNKEKVFTLEDMVKAHTLGWDSSNQWNGGNSKITELSELIKSLQQPTEIEVDVVMECKTGCVNFIFNDENSLCCGDKVPRLDENNCLILKQLENEIS
jgi:hypothetical protein